MPNPVIQNHRDIMWLLLAAFATWAAYDPTYRAYRRGVFRPLRYVGRQPQYRRTEEPIRYWLSMLGAGFACLVCLLFTIFFAIAVILDLL